MADGDEALRFLAPFLPVGLEGPVTIQLGLPALRAAVCTSEALRKAASSQPGVIIIHPQFYEPDTAAGLALIAHEMYHQWQFQVIPNLLELYNAEEEHVQAQGLPPYANKYEWPAYELEAEVYQRALQQGYPPGTHIPLLLQRGIAAKTPAQMQNGGAGNVALYLAAAAFVFNIVSTMVQASRQA